MLFCSIQASALQDRVKRIENCVNVQSQVPTDPTVKNFGMQIKGQMMDVRVHLHATDVLACNRLAQLALPLHRHISALLLETVLVRLH